MRRVFRVRVEDRCDFMRAFIRFPIFHVPWEYPIELMMDDLAVKRRKRKREKADV